MEKLSSTAAKAFVGEHYRTWRGVEGAHIAEAPFMQRLRSGELSKQALRLFFRNCACIAGSRLFILKVDPSASELEFPGSPKGFATSVPPRSGEFSVNPGAVSLDAF
jgi:hypothetical protein